MRLINRAKIELGSLSKFIIETMTKELRHKLDMNQWKNTEAVIDWFKSIKEKQLCKFVIFDITKPAITCSKLKIETLEQGVKYVQS